MTRRLQPVVAVVLVAVLVGIPLWLVVMTAGKSRGEALNPDLSPPTEWHLWENLREVWDRGRIPEAFFGSLVIMVPAVVIVLLLGSMAAWVLARRAGRVFAFVYAAGISGIPTKEMDWNADGTVTQQEIMQSFYAVGVTKTSQGQRECSEYYWRDGKRSIRVDCRTTMATEPAKE